MYARQKILFTFTINIENMVKTHHIRFYLIKLLITTFSIIFAAWILQKGIHIEDPKLATCIIVAITLPPPFNHADYPFIHSKFRHIYHIYQCLCDSIGGFFNPEILC